VNPKDSEAGTGLLGSIVGVTIFLVLLLYAVQLALNLYATSTVTAITFDAARQVAGSDGGPDATGRAEEQARGMLDRYETNGGTLDFRWDTSRADVVVLEVTAERPSFFAHVRVPFQRIHRTVTVRWERAR
jgi:hypothetical protein